MCCKNKTKCFGALNTFFLTCIFHPTYSTVLAGDNNYIQLVISKYNYQRIITELILKSYTYSNIHITLIANSVLESRTKILSENPSIKIFNIYKP